MFKFLANFGSNALSVLSAGKFALRRIEALTWNDSHDTLGPFCHGRVYRTPVLLVVHDHYRF